MVDGALRLARFHSDQADGVVVAAREEIAGGVRARRLAEGSASRPVRNAARLLEAAQVHQHQAITTAAHSWFGFNASARSRLLPGDAKVAVTVGLDRKGERRMRPPGSRRAPEPGWPPPSLRQRVLHRQMSVVLSNDSCRRAKRRCTFVDRNRLVEGNRPLEVGAGPPVPVAALQVGEMGVGVHPARFHDGNAKPHLFGNSIGDLRFDRSRSLSS
jgi:hypothetical protein